MSSWMRCNALWTGAGQFAVKADSAVCDNCAMLTFYFTQNASRRHFLFMFTLIASTVYLTHFALTYEQPLTSGVTDVQERTFFYSAQSDYKRSH